MDVLQDLQHRRSNAQLAAEMLIMAGKVCEEAGLVDAAKLVFTVAYIEMDTMQQIDQALAILDEGETKVVPVDMVCGKCGVVENSRAVVNILVKEDEQGWEELGCQSCDNGHIGHIRRDRKGVPTGYLLTISGVADARPDTRTRKELRAAAEDLGTSGVVKPEELPSVGELKATLYGETLGSPVAVEHRSKEQQQKASIREKLNAAKAKMGASPEAFDDDEEENDF